MSYPRGRNKNVGAFGPEPSLLYSYLAIDGGGTGGFTSTGLAEGSFFAATGIEPGDGIVEAIYYPASPSTYEGAPTMTPITSEIGISASGRIYVSTTATTDGTIGIRYCRGPVFPLGANSG